MDFIVETVLEVAGEIISEGVEAAITTRKEKKRESEKGENKDGSEELNH